MPPPPSPPPSPVLPGATARARPRWPWIAAAAASLAVAIGVGVAARGTDDGATAEPAPVVPVVPTGRGRVYLDADPPLTVSLYGEHVGFLELGSTPVRGRELAAGTYVVTLRRADGRARIDTLDVPAGGEVRRTLSID